MIIRTRPVFSRWISLLTGLLFTGGALAAHHEEADHAAAGFKGRITLSSKLDEPDGLCLDIPGPPDNMRLDIGAWAHTCHPEPVIDQVFLFDTNGNQHIRSAVPETSICLAAKEAKADAGMIFATCEEAAALQQFTYLPNGQLQLTSTADAEDALCVAAETTGPPPFTPPAEGQDARGESIAINPMRSHLARFIRMQPCAKAGLEMSQWEAFVERSADHFSAMAR